MSYVPPPEQGPVQYQSPAPGNDPGKFNWAAITSLCCGIASLLAWCIPLCGCPVTIAGIVFGVIGMKSEKRTLAIWGLALSILGLVGTLINGAIGAYMQATGQHPWFKP